MFCAEQPFAAPLMGPPMGLMRGQSMRAVLSRQNSARSSPIVSGKHGSFTLGGGASLASPSGGAGGAAGGGGGVGASSSGKEEARTPVGAAQPAVFKLETVSACQLITYIYEAKVRLKYQALNAPDIKNILFLPNICRSKTDWKTCRKLTSSSARRCWSTPKM